MKLLMQALDASPSAIVIIDNNGQIIEANAAMTTIFGYLRDELINSKIELLLPKNMREKHKEHVRNFFSQPRNRQMGDGEVFVGERQDGTKIRVQVGINFFTEGEKTFGVANIIDVSEAYRMEQLIERTQEVAKIGSWQVDLATNKVRWSTMTYKIHELDENQEIVIEDGINFYAPEYRPVIRQCIENCVIHGEPWDEELKIITTSGRELWVRAIGSAIYENKKIVGLQGTFQDIHEQKLQSEEREQLVNKLEATEVIAKIGHWQWILEPEKIVWSNNLYQLWGLPLDAPVPSIEEHGKWVVKEDHELFFSSLQEGIEKRQAYAVDFRANVNGELKYMRGEGKPIFGLNGKHIGFFGTCQDITEQTLFNERLRSTTYRLTLALEASSVGVWEWVIPSDELIWDEQMYALYGIAASDFEGAYDAWTNGLHPEDIEASQNLIQEVLAGTAKFDTEFRVVWPNGAVRFIRALATLERKDDGQAYKLIGVNWDITRIKQYQQELLDSNTSLAVANGELMQFTYRTSHDLKGPLVAIRALADMALNDLKSNKAESVSKNLSFISEQASMLENLVKDLLELAKVDMQTTSTEDIDFKAIMAEVIGLNQSLAKVNQVAIDYTINVNKKWRFPAVRILQILNNLVSNSVKYCDFNKESRFVHIVIQETKNSLKILVKDNGTGIDCKDKEDVFKMFKRFHSKKLPGSGLGMYVLRKHLDFLKGDVDFETSEAGSVFSLTIPKG